MWISTNADSLKPISIKTQIRRIFFALGDIAGRAPLTPVAVAAGRRLADRLYDAQSDRHLDYQNIATVVFSHPPIGTVGLTEAKAIEKTWRFGQKYIRPVFTAMFQFN